MAQIIIYVLLDLPIPSELKGTSGTLFSLVSLYLPLFRPFLLPGKPDTKLFTSEDSERSQQVQWCRRWDMLHT